jgi:uncharacterized protein YndB with AHSA1/START domain
MSTLTAPPNPLDKTYDLPASAERVFAAITESAHLDRWFAEHTRIEPREGGAYRFWGRHTAWINAEAQSDGRITAFKPGSRLAYTFTWRDTHCEVDLRVEPSGDGASKLHVRMSAAPPQMGFGEECGWYMLDFWRHSVGNLRHYLKTGAAVLRPDFTARGPLDLSVFVAAPPEKVFAALTDPAKMDKWLSAKAAVDLRPGGEFSFGWTIKDKAGRDTLCGPSKLVEVVPNRLIVHNWSHRDEAPSTVRWELTPAPGGTMVRLTHTVPTDEPSRGGYVGGWTSFLVELAAMGPGL